MEVRDAVVSWLELGGNFLRVTAHPSLPSTRHGRAKLLAESAALDELAAFVNKRLCLDWDAQHARKMLRQCLKEYRYTAEAAASADFSVGEFPTVQLKLDAMCRNFQRLQALHKGCGGPSGAKQREDIRDQKATTYVELPIDLVEAERLKRVPESGLSHSCENNETDRKDEKQLQRSSESTISERDEVVTVILREGDEEQERKDARTGAGRNNVEKENGKEDDNHEVAAGTKRGSMSTRGPMKVTSRGGKRVLSTKTTTPEEKMNVVKSSKKLQKHRMDQMFSSRERSADEDSGDQEVPRIRGSTRAKRRSAWLLDTGSRSPSLEEDDLTLRKKMRRVIPAKTGRVDVLDIAATQTTRSTSSSSSGEPYISLVGDENTARLDTRIHDNISSGKKRASGLNVPSASAPRKTAGRIPSSSSQDGRDKQTTTSVKPSSSATHNGKISTTITAAVQGNSRLAMEEFMSRRQQLMSRVADPFLSRSGLQKRHRSLSESDCSLSDLDHPSVDAKPSVSREMTPSDTPRGAGCESGPSPGLLPPLIHGSRTTNGKSNLERKRTFFRAKQLVFEQLKWHRENEMQQRELELLRRELVAREALAKQELSLKRMRIRADIIQPMISAGASVADIAECLKML